MFDPYEAIIQPNRRQPTRTRQDPGADNAGKLKLTDAERHKRFVEMARKVEASDDPKDFDKAFKKVALPMKKKPS